MGTRSRTFGAGAKAITAVFDVGSVHSENMQRVAVYSTWFKRTLRECGAHDALVCAYILVLNFGRRIADGESLGVLRHPDVITAYLGAE